MALKLVVNKHVLSRLKLNEISSTTFILLKQHYAVFLSKNEGVRFFLNNPLTSNKWWAADSFHSFGSYELIHVNVPNLVNLLSFATFSGSERTVCASVGCNPPLSRSKGCRCSVT